MKQPLIFRLFCLTAFLASQLLVSTLLAQTLPECAIEALPKPPPEYPNTLCQRFQGIQIPPHQIQPPPIILGVPGWQTDTDVFAQTGSSVLTNKTVLVQGNFTVTSTFEFNNCWVQFSPGIKITVGNGTAAQPLLTVTNSRLFCCTGLWAGIDMEPNARVNTQSNTEIEDATTAIIADADANTLSLQNTTFNRNRIGVQLGKTGSSGGTSVTMVNFSANKFTCTSPLNTTASEITFAGVLVQRITGITTLNGASEFIKIKYGIYVGVHSQAVVLGQTFLNVYSSKFDQVIQKGIFTEPPMVMNVLFCVFINNGTHCIDVLKADHLQVRSCHITYNDDVISNTDNFYYGIRFNPFGSNILFNDQRIKLNTFDVRFAYPPRQETIHCISMYGASDGAIGDHEIDYNEFLMNINQPPPGEVPETRAISITGGIHPNLTENTILENHFEFENHNAYSTVCAVNVTNGDYSNLQISGNQFHHTMEQPFLLGEIGIRLAGSTGSNNLLRSNIFDDVLSSQSHAYNFGIYVKDFDNTNYEYNILRECNTGFFYNGMSENTNMICNDMIGGAELLKLEGAVIGQQGNIDGNGNIIVTNGNEWENVEVPPFDANCSPAILAPFSKFYVTGSQSASNTFFPDQLNPASGWFVGGGPITTCEASASQNSLEKSIANGDLATALNNPADSWEAERYLYNRLNWDSDLLNSWSGFQNFKLSKDGSTMAQLSAVQEMINNAYVPSSSLAVQVAQKKGEIDNLLDQAIQLDEQIYNGETSILLAQRVQVQANLAVRQSEVANLDAAFQSEVATKLQAAQSINNGIEVTAVYEVNAKTINDFVITLSLFGTLSETQVNSLKAIAAQCPRTGGMAVYKARGILPECELALINEDICYPSEERVKAEILDNGGSRLQIIPNPNKGSFTLRADDIAGSKVSIYDVFGRLMTEHLVSETAATQSVEQGLRPGTYFCRVTDASGSTRVVAFVVTR